MLLDTGPLVAILDVHDQWHEAVRDVMPRIIDRCLTTEAVVTEACHLSARGGGPHARPLEFLLAAPIPIVSLDMRLHSEVALLMQRYTDLPMDYADATLVALADALRVDTVFTTDRRGFRAYRGARGTRLELVPA